MKRYYEFSTSWMVTGSEIDLPAGDEVIAACRSDRRWGR